MKSILRTALTVLVLLLAPVSALADSYNLGTLASDFGSAAQLGSCTWDFREDGGS
jgi:hypothetical protein